MRKEQMEDFLEKVPFKLITKKGTVMTCRNIIRLDEDTITFRDKFGSTIIQELNQISTIQASRESGGGNSKCFSPQQDNDPPDPLEGQRPRW